MKFYLKFKYLPSRKCVWTCRLRNGGHFVQGRSIKCQGSIFLFWKLMSFSKFFLMLQLASWLRTGSGNGLSPVGRIIWETPHITHLRTDNESRQDQRTRKSCAFYMIYLKFDVIFNSVLIWLERYMIIYYHSVGQQSCWMIPYINSTALFIWNQINIKHN